MNVAAAGSLRLMQAFFKPPPPPTPQHCRGKLSRLCSCPCVKTPVITCVMDERAHHHLIIPQQDKYGGGGRGVCVGGAFKNKCYPLGGKGLEWSIYHGLKWCLSPTKVLIIQSEEELPAHYLPENNNADTPPHRPSPRPALV